MTIPARLDLTSLHSGMPGLTSACGTSIAESAAVCLEEHGHTTGVQVQLHGLYRGQSALFWDTVSSQQKSCYNDLQEATERGAYAVAILVVRELTKKVVIERSKKGPGFDYWVGDQDQDDDALFNNKYRLEVSGILRGSTSEINARLRQKKAQLAPSDALAPAYIVIVEFSGPVTHLEVK